MYQFIEVNVKRCTGAGCRTKSEIDSYLNGIVVSINILNSYVDFNK